RTLSWKQLRRHANSELIFNPSLVFRQFSADFPRDGNYFKLLLIEKKYDDPEHDFAYEKYAPEVLIVDDEGELVTTLTDSVIERADMLRLADMVETRSDKASKLFSSVPDLKQ
ncbi:MAG: hypothetical protein ABWY27_02350, partial [Telluria sp.]